MAVTGTVVTRVSPSLLRLALAWELQAQALGHLSRDTTRMLDQLARSQTRVSETEAKPIRWFKERYAPFLARAIAHPLPFIAGGAGMLAAAEFAFGFLGEDSTPYLHEKEVTVGNFRVPSASIEQSTAI